MEEQFIMESWEPKTELGQMIKRGEITSLEQIFHLGKRVEELEIIDILLPNLKNEVIEIASVQRMTKNNRKQKLSG